MSNDPTELMPDADVLLDRFNELRDYVSLSDDDIRAAIEAWPLVELDCESHVEDFYAEIMRHPEAHAVITGGAAQVQRLKQTLRDWIARLFTGQYDLSFVQHRWTVGWRHVQIGLPQVWTAGAMSRLSNRITTKLTQRYQRSGQLANDAGFEKLRQATSAISRLMDLDLALIQDAYHAQSVALRLQSERDFAESIIGTAQAIVMVVDATGTILRENRFLTRLVLGNGNNETPIGSISQFLPEDDCEKLLALLGKVSCESAHLIETDLTDAKQRRRQVRWFAKEFEYRQGASRPPVTQAYLLVGHDITDLSEAQRRLVQSERLAAIGQTMAGLAHESRNAFQRSQASLETLALEVSDRPEAVELIERIQRAHDHLLHLYEEVLQFAKPVTLDLDEHRVNDLVTRTWTHLVDAGVATPNGIVIEHQEGVSTILCDGFAIEQVLRNLMENALSVNAEGVVIDVLIAPTWQGDREAVRIHVRDSGPGIPEQYRAKIFEPFFSTRSRGTGLGLPIARRLTEAHGGSLELVSSDDGTTAELTLPIKAQYESASDPEDRPDYRRNA